MISINSLFLSCTLLQPGSSSSSYKYQAQESWAAVIHYIDLDVGLDMLQLNISGKLSYKLDVLNEIGIQLG